MSSQAQIDHAAHQAAAAVGRASQSEAQSRADQRTRERFGAQRVLWRESTIERIQRCGRRTTGDDVQLRVSTGADGHRVSGFAGLQTCGSVWACPVCSAKVLSKRQTEITAAVDQADRLALRVAMFTYTMRHNARQTLGMLWDANSSGWHSITSGAAHQAEKSAYGVETSRELITECPAKNCGADNHYGRRHAPNCKIGTYKTKHVLPWIRVVEITHGLLGWHVHIHVLVFLPKDTTDGARDALYDAWWTRWNKGLESAGVDGSLRVNRPEWMTGKDVARNVGNYVTKQTYSAGQVAGLEAARADLKTGRFGNRAAFEILRDMIAQPNGPEAVKRDAAIWREYEAASQGRRQIAWASGSRALFDLEPEATDEEIAAEELGSALDTIAQLSPAEWSRLVAVPGRRLELLVAARVSDAAARSVLDGWGLLWTLPEGRQQYGRVNRS